MPTNDFDPNAFQRALDESLRRGKEAFLGLYRDELQALAGLSRAEIDAISPGVTDLQTYDQLMIVVKEASRVNLAQAQLKSQIVKLGDLGVKIAKKVPSLAKILLV